MSEKLELRVYGDGSLPTLIYLPGLHGDWTLVGSFRRALGGRVRFVEMTYPRTLEWSLDDYAAAIEAALAERGIARGWLLGESFGSQVLWGLVARSRLADRGRNPRGRFRPAPDALGCSPGWARQWRHFARACSHACCLVTPRWLAFATGIRRRSRPTSRSLLTGARRWISRPPNTGCTSSRRMTSAPSPGRPTCPFMA